MRILQILSLIAAVGLFCGTILIGNSITKDVNENMGSHHDGIWSSSGNRIWKEHERLFPANRKRAALAITLVAAFALFMATAFLSR